MIDRKKFYDSVRASLFGGKITPMQLNGMDGILDEWDESGLTDLRWLSYMFATTFHETAKTMQPIHEYGGKDYFIKRYWANVKIRKELGNLSPQDAVSYAGKGYVQLTGRNNYKKMGKLLGINLLDEPNKAMLTPIAVKIMFEGMTTGKSYVGDFTSKHLGNYFNNAVNDPVNARRIINGVDKAQSIAAIYNKFLSALS